MEHGFEMLVISTVFLQQVGYLVGNGCTDREVDGDSFPTFAAGE